MLNGAALNPYPVFKQAVTGCDIEAAERAAEHAADALKHKIKPDQ